MQGQPDQIQTLTTHLLQGLFNKLVSRNYIRNIVAKIDLECQVSEQNRI